MDPTATQPLLRIVHPSRLRLAMVAVFSVLALGRVVDVDVFERPDRWAFDRLVLPLLPEPRASDEILVVAIDDRSLAELGERWPLSRATWARFIELTLAWEPALVVADVVFDQPGEGAAADLATAVVGFIDVHPDGDAEVARAVRAMVELERERLDADMRLATAIAEAGNVILGAFFFDRVAHPTIPDRPQALTPIPGSPDGLTLQVVDAVTSHPAFTVAALGSGSMNVLVDHDGTVRRYPYAVAMGDRVYPSLALAAALHALADDADREARAGAIIERALRKDGGAPRLRFRSHRNPFPQVAFSDLLLAAPDDEARRAAIKGRVLFVGAAATGVEDQVRTTFAHRTPGVIVHATATENLLRDDHHVTGGVAAWLSGLETLLALLLFLRVMRREPPPRRLLLAAGLVGGLHVALLYAAAAGPGWALALTPAPLGMAALGISELVLRWRTQRRTQEALAARQRLLEADRAALERFRAVVGNVADGIVTVDEAGRITWMNGAAESLFMRGLESAVRRHIGALVPEWKGGVPLSEAVPGRRAAAAREVEAHRPHGATFPAEVTVTEMRLGGERFLNCVFRDVAARKASEQVRDDLVSTINHELRTPITSIIGALKLLDAGVTGPLPEEAARLVAIAGHNGERLLGLVNDLLDLSRLESGATSYDLEPIAIAPLVARAVEENRGYGSGYDVPLVFEPGDEDGARVRGNARHLLQVMANLLSNAVKHSNPGEPVTVSLETTGDRIRIAVTDRGPGITVESRPHIFEKFATTAAGDGRKRPGTGLGLSIAKRIVEDHEGTIGFTTEVGVGTTFWLELPRLS